MDADLVGAFLEVGERVGALGVGGRGGHDVTVRVEEVDGHTLVELLAVLEGLGAVGVTVDGALDRVVRGVTKVHVLHGGVVVVHLDDAGGVVLGAVRVLGLLELLEEVGGLHLDGVLAGGQLGEGVRAVCLRRGRRDDRAVLAEQVHGDAVEAGLGVVEGLGAVLVVVDGAGDGVVLGVAEVDVDDIRVGACEGDRLRARVGLTRGILGLLLVRQRAGLVDLDGVGTVVQAGEGVVAIRVGRRSSHDVAVLVEQLHGDAGQVDIARVLRLVAVLVEVDGAGDRVLLNVSEVDVLADRVVGVEGDRAGGVVLRAIRILGLGQLGDVASLGDLDRVGSGIEAGEGVVAVRVGLGGGDDVTIGAEQLDRDVLEGVLTVVERGGLVRVVVHLAGQAVLDGDRRRGGVIAGHEVVLGRVHEGGRVVEGLAVGVGVQRDGDEERGVFAGEHVANGPRGAVEGAGLVGALTFLRQAGRVAGGALVRLGGHEGGTGGEGFLDLEVGGLALADVAGVDAVGDLVAGLQVGGVGDDGLVEGDVEREGHGDLDRLGRQDGAVVRGLGGRDRDGLVGDAGRVIGGLDGRDDRDRCAGLDRGGLAVDVDAVGLHVGPRGRGGGPVVVASGGACCHGVALVHDFAAAGVVGGGVLDGDLRGVDARACADLEGASEDGCPLGATGVTALDGGVTNMGQDAVHGHVGQVRVTGVGGGDAVLAVFTLADHGHAVGVLLVGRAFHGAEALEDDVGASLLGDREGRGDGANLVGRIAITVDVVGVVGGAVEADRGLLGGQRVLGFGRGDVGLVLVRAGAHRGADLAAQLDGGATLGLVAGPGDLDELAGAAGGVGDVADRDGLFLTCGTAGDGVLDEGHAAGQQVGDDGLGVNDGRGVVRGDAEGNLGAGGRQVALDGGLGVVVLGQRGAQGEDVAVVVGGDLDRSGAVEGLHGPVGDTVLDAHVLVGLAGLPCGGVGVGLDVGRAVLGRGGACTDGAGDVEDRGLTGGDRLLVVEDGQVLVGGEGGEVECLAAVDGLSAGVALVGPVGDLDGRRRLGVDRLDAHEGLVAVLGAIGRRHEATGQVVGVLHDDRDVGVVGVAVQPVTLLATLELAHGALVEAAAVADLAVEAVREGGVGGDNVGLVVHLLAGELRGVGDGLIRAGVVVVDGDGQDDVHERGVDVADVPGDGVGRGVVGALDGRGRVRLGVTRGRGGHVLRARRQRVGDDDIGHVGLAVEAVHVSVVLRRDLVGHVDVLGGRDRAGLAQERRRLGLDRDGRLGGFLAVPRGEGRDRGDGGAAGGHAARGGEGQDRLERRACGDCSEVVGDEAVGARGRSLDRGGDDLLAGGGRGVDAVGRRIGVRVTRGGHRVGQRDGHDRVETVLRGGGAGELDNVALLNTGEVRGLVGCDGEFERRGRRICGQRRDAEHNEGGRDQHGKQLGRLGSLRPRVIDVHSLLLNVRKVYISSQFYEFRDKCEEAVFRDEKPSNFTHAGQFSNNG